MLLLSVRGFHGIRVRGGVKRKGKLVLQATKKSAADIEHEAIDTYSCHLLPIGIILDFNTWWKTNYSQLLYLVRVGIERKVWPIAFRCQMSVGYKMVK